MKILACSVRGGDVCATVLAEKEDCLRSGGGHAAVEGCIHRFADEKGLPALALARVTRMQETADGGIEFDFDAAVPPQVKLGKYLGLEVYVPADESPDLPVLRAAAETLEADIPETYISRKIDGLVRQRLEDVAQRPGFNTLADMYAVLRAASGELALGYDDNALWDMALAVSDELNAGNMRARSSREITELLASALYPGAGGDHAFAVIERALENRAACKRAESVETIAEESFASYLRMAGKSMAELRGEFRPLAEELVRIDLLIDEVAAREHITLSDEEFDTALETIASMYELPPSEVLGMIGASTLRAQLVRDKARAMIVDSADTFLKKQEDAVDVLLGLFFRSIEKFLARLCASAAADGNKLAACQDEIVVRERLDLSLGHPVAAVAVDKGMGKRVLQQSGRRLG